MVGNNCFEYMNVPENMYVLSIKIHSSFHVAPILRLQTKGFRQNSLYYPNKRLSINISSLQTTMCHE